MGKIGYGNIRHSFRRTTGNFADGRIQAGTFVFHEEYQLEEFRFTILPTPGHSIGGVSILFPDAHLVLTGDALFRETIGRTDLPTGSTEQLLHSIQTQLFTLPNYDVYPGHGPATTIAHEKTFNPFF